MSYRFPASFDAGGKWHTGENDLEGRCPDRSQEGVMMMFTQLEEINRKPPPGQRLPPRACGPMVSREHPASPRVDAASAPALPFLTR